MCFSESRQSCEDGSCASTKLVAIGAGKKKSRLKGRLMDTLQETVRARAQRCIPGVNGQSQYVLYVSWDRSCGFFTVDEPSRLYSQQPPSNRTSVSPRIRLYASPSPPSHRWAVGGVMNPASLRSAGEAELPGLGVCVRMPKRPAGRFGVPREAVVRWQTVLIKHRLPNTVSGREVIAFRRATQPRYTWSRRPG